MLRLGTLPLGSIPRIVAPLSERDLRGPTDGVRRHADVAELRIDRFARHELAHVAQLCRAARRLALPLIATVRAARQSCATCAGSWRAKRSMRSSATSA